MYTCIIYPIYEKKWHKSYGIKGAFYWYKIWIIYKII